MLLISSLLEWCFYLHISSYDFRIVTVLSSLPFPVFGLGYHYEKARLLFPAVRCVSPMCCKDIQACNAKQTVVLAQSSCMFELHISMVLLHAQFAVNAP